MANILTRDGLKTPEQLEREETVRNWYAKEWKCECGGLIPYIKPFEEYVCPCGKYFSTPDGSKPWPIAPYGDLAAYDPSSSPLQTLINKAKGKKQARVVDATNTCPTCAPGTCPYGVRSLARILEKTEVDDLAFPTRSELVADRGQLFFNGLQDPSDFVGLVEVDAPVGRSPEQTERLERFLRPLRRHP